VLTYQKNDEILKYMKNVQHKKKVIIEAKKILKEMASTLEDFDEYDNLRHAMKINLEDQFDDSDPTMIRYGREYWEDQIITALNEFSEKVNTLYEEMFEKLLNGDYASAAYKKPVLRDIDNE